MNMFANLLGGLVDKQAIAEQTSETIVETINKLALEYQCPKTDLFIMIKPKAEEDLNTYWVYKLELQDNGNKVPTCKREITLNEILGIKDDAG